MARGVKGTGTRGRRKPLDDRIAEAQKSIEILRDKLDKEEKAYEDLLDEKKKGNVDELMKVMEESGVSLEQIKEQIKEMAKNSRPE